MRNIKRLKAAAAAVRVRRKAEARTALTERILLVLQRGPSGPKRISEETKKTIYMIEKALRVLEARGLVTHTERMANSWKLSTPASPESDSTTTD